MDQSRRIDYPAQRYKGRTHLKGLSNQLKEFAVSGYWLVPLFWLMVVLPLSSYFGSDYSPDSYYYSMLGRNVISGHGYLTSIIRENLPEANFYSRSYPPVMPLLCGLANLVLHTGIASGFLIDLLALYGMLHVCYLLGRRLIPRLFYLLPATCCMFVFINTPFTDELLAGRSIPVAAFLFLVLLLLVTEKEDLTRRRAMAVGACLGLTYLTRFDVSLFCLFFPLLLCWMRQEKLKQSRFIYLGMLFAVSPWLVRNFLTFGKLFVSSNWVAVVSTFPSETPTLMYFKDGVPSGIANPTLWISLRVESLIAHIAQMAGSFIPYGQVAFIFGLIVLLLNGLGIAGRRGDRGMPIFAGVFFLWMFLDLVTVTITLLPDARYFSIVALLGLLGAAMSAATRALEKLGRRSIEPGKNPSCRWSAVTAALVIGVTLLSHSPQWFLDGKKSFFEEAYAAFNPFISQEELVGCDGYADNFAYYTPWKMIYAPTNTVSPADRDFIGWKEHFHVRHLIIMDQSPFLHYPVQILAKSGPFILIDLGK